MRKRQRTATSLLIVFVLLATSSLLAGTPDEPEVVQVQHILIGFKKSVRGKKLERTKNEARALAEELLERARAEDADFDALVQEYTDDSYPGIHTLTNDDAPRRAGATPRNGMVPGFGDVAFSLEVGEVGLAPYSYTASPYGWHVIKRLE